MSWITVGVAVGGYILNSQAASNAADAQSSAARRAQEQASGQYNQTREDQRPWREAGGGALQMLTRGMGIHEPARQVAAPAPARAAAAPAPASAQPVANNPNALWKQDDISQRLANHYMSIGRADLAAPYMPAQSTVAPAPAAAPTASPAGGSAGLTNSVASTVSGIMQKPGAVAASPAPGMASIMPLVGEAMTGSGNSQMVNTQVMNPGDPGYDDYRGGDMAEGDFNRDFTMADYEADPGYAFRLAQGEKALQRSAAARGGMLGGGALKSLARYSQGVASEEYGNAYNRFNSDRDRRFNRLSTIAGIGQTASGQLQQAGQNYSSAYGAAQSDIGNAQSAGIVGQNNALTGAIGNVANNWMQRQEMNKTPSLSNSGQRTYAT
jgi:hypothetical protein